MGANEKVEATFHGATDSPWEHPRLVLSIRTRTRLFGTVNAAFALRGRSTGWGRGSGHPRRTFFAHNRINPGGGWHFAEVSVRREGPKPVWKWTAFRRRVGGAS